MHVWMLRMRSWTRLDAVSCLQPVAAKQPTAGQSPTHTQHGKHTQHTHATHAGSEACFCTLVGGICTPVPATQTSYLVGEQGVQGIGSKCGVVIHMGLVLYGRAACRNFLGKEQQAKAGRHADVEWRLCRCEAATNCAAQVTLPS